MQAANNSTEAVAGNALAIHKAANAMASKVGRGLPLYPIPRLTKIEGEPNGARLLFKGINFDDIIDQFWLLFDEFRIFDCAFADSYDVD